MSLPLPTTLSPSKISAFKHCPLQFRFSVIDRLPEPPSPAASKGTLVHRALELLMLRAPAERTPAAALAGLEQARAELAGHPEFAGLGLNEEELDVFHADARALLLRYFDIEDPAAVRPIGLELRLSVAMGSLTLRGVIDRLERPTSGPSRTGSAACTSTRSCATGCWDGARCGSSSCTSPGPRCCRSAPASSR